MSEAARSLRGAEATPRTRSRARRRSSPPARRQDRRMRRCARCCVCRGSYTHRSSRVAGFLPTPFVVHQTVTRSPQMSRVSVQAAQRRSSVCTLPCRTGARPSGMRSRSMRSRRRRSSRPRPRAATRRRPRGRRHSPGRPPASARLGVDARAPRSDDASDLDERLQRQQASRDERHRGLGVAVERALDLDAPAQAAAARHATLQCRELGRSRAAQAQPRALALEVHIGCVVVVVDEAVVAILDRLPGADPGWQMQAGMGTPLAFDLEACDVPNLGCRFVWELPRPHPSPRNPCCGSWFTTLSPSSGVLLPPPCKLRTT